MSEEEKKRQRIYDLLNVEIKQKFLCLLYKKHFTEKVLFKEKGCRRLNKNEKKAF